MRLSYSVQVSSAFLLLIFCILSFSKQEKTSPPNNLNVSTYTVEKPRFSLERNLKSNISLSASQGTISPGISLNLNKHVQLHWNDHQIQLTSFKYNFTEESAFLNKLKHPHLPFEHLDLKLYKNNHPTSIHNFRFSGMLPQKQLNQSTLFKCDQINGDMNTLTLLETFFKPKNTTITTQVNPETNPISNNDMLYNVHFKKVFVHYSLAFIRTELDSVTFNMKNLTLRADKGKLKLNPLRINVSGNVFLDYQKQYYKDVSGLINLASPFIVIGKHRFYL